MMFKITFQGAVKINETKWLHNSNGESLHLAFEQMFKIFKYLILVSPKWSAVVLTFEIGQNIEWSNNFSQQLK